MLNVLVVLPYINETKIISIRKPSVFIRSNNGYFRVHFSLKVICQVFIALIGGVVVDDDNGFGGYICV